MDVDKIIVSRQILLWSSQKQIELRKCDQQFRIYHRSVRTQGLADVRIHPHMCSLCTKNTEMGTQSIV